MINISIVTDKKGFIWGFEIKGHAGYDEYGKDIVCAAVSTLAYTAVGAISEMTDIVSYSEKDGYMQCTVPKNISNDAKNTVKIILDTIVIGFKQIELSYKGYVKVIIKEV